MDLEIFKSWEGDRINGKYDDYVNEIQASRKLGYPAYRIAPEGCPTLVFTYENKVFAWQLISNIYTTYLQKL